jgi:hypothetical protein
MPLSQKFREAFRDIFEKSILVLLFAACALVLHFAKLGCSALHAPYWLILLIDFLFAFSAIADALIIVSLTVALLMRFLARTVREVKSIITGK